MNSDHEYIAIVNADALLLAKALQLGCRLYADVESELPGQSVIGHMIEGKRRRPIFFVISALSKTLSVDHKFGQLSVLLLDVLVRTVVMVQKNVRDVLFENDAGADYLGRMAQSGGIAVC